MRKVFILICLVASLSALSKTSAEGEDIFSASKCVRCHHSGDNYNPKGRSVKSLNDLQKWVNHSRVKLSDDRRDKVVAYLNEIYYHLK